MLVTGILVGTGNRVQHVVGRAGGLEAMALLQPQLERHAQPAHQVGHPPGRHATIEQPHHVL